MALLASHDPLLESAGAGGGVGADQWQPLSSVMSRGYKCPRWARRSSEQSQRSQPGRLGWRDRCQEDQQNSLFWEALSSLSRWIF